MPVVKMKNKDIYYDDSGSGPVLIFVHPPGMGRKTFVKQLKLSQSLRIILPDLSGHGDSPSIKNSITVQTYVEEIEALRNQLNASQIYLFGYSAGGIIVQEYAIQFPYHVKGVILSGGYPKVDTELLKNEHLIGIYLVEHFPKVLARVLAISHFRDKELQHEMYLHILRSNPEIWASFYRESLHYNSLSRMDKLNSPMMLLYSSGPDYINYHVRLFPKIIDTEVHFIQAIGHQIPTKKDKKVNFYVQQFIQRIESN